MKKNLTFLINQIKITPDESVDTAYALAKVRLSKLGIKPHGLDFSVFRKSVDARRKDDIHLVYTVAVRGALPEISKERLAALGMSVLFEEEISPRIGNMPLTAPPVVVGSGPCGLFAALLLAENGYRPIILERGGSIEERCRSVERFYRERILDTDNNIQFGAGGAGTFSDGKLLTRVGDPSVSYILRRFVEFGAPSDILTLSKPHIGTDILRTVVERMISHILTLGGKILYHTRLSDVLTRGGEAYAVKTSEGEIPCGALVLAVGHSARDTYEMLMERGFSIQAKAFSVGMRIEHLTSDIDQAMYGRFAGHSALGHAEYALSHNTKERGVYTFCMCPGGEVVAGASEEGGVVVNGMSYHARDGKNSNSAILCSIFKEDYGASPMEAIALQRRIERAAYAAGGGDYSAPVSTVGDFLCGTHGSAPTRVKPTYMQGDAYRLCTPESYLPKLVTSAIADGIRAFDRRISGFAASSAILTGAETRTSAPIRILRSEDTKTALGFSNVYPAGEGAGYAGGITSAAVDGIRVAEALIGRYMPIQ